MAAPLLSLKGVGLGFGGRPLFEDVDLAVQDGDRLCLVGRNGSGKSTLLKILAGQIEPDAGERLVRQGARAAYLPQDPDLGGYGRVADYVAAGLSAVGEAHQVDILLAAVGVAGDADPATLSGGEARRAAIARCLVGDPDVLLLDEPTNHLDLPTIEWLEGALAAFRGAVVMISHDRRFLNDLGRETVWLERGRLRRVERRLADFETWREEFFEKEAAERARMDKLIAEETRWSHQGITARRKRNQGRLRRLHELRGERARQIARIGNVKLALESGTSSGRLVVDAENVAKHYGDRPILADVSVRVLRGDRIGIIGPNGAGKSTLLRLLTGDLAPDAGTVRLGTNLTTVYLDQQRSSLDPDRTVWDTLCEGGGDQVIVHGRPRHVVSYLRDFLFDERQARSPVGALSGGERNRLLLARALARPSNFLILDEPTNDLDMDTLDLLQELLADYDGTLLLVSHDRDFLDRVVTATLAVEGDGRVSEYPGGFSDYERQRKAPAADAAPKKKPSGSEKPKSSSAKLSYKDKRDLELLPGRIADLEQTLVRLESELADPALYQNQPETFAAKARELEANQADLAAAEERWLELELLKEELGG